MCIGGPAPGSTTLVISSRSASRRTKVIRLPWPSSIVWGYIGAAFRYS